MIRLTVRAPNGKTRKIWFHETSTVIDMGDHCTAAFGLDDASDGYAWMAIPKNVLMISQTATLESLKLTQDAVVEVLLMQLSK